ncbi:hypothetical protein ACFWBF_12525 [Streptomyces sp. NPDC060028]|uniref:hypothetical protein n=1 Tax=Streptomyces sp. NPDC060028 TaxID=3347041 RepID=UPI003678384B
MVTRFEGYSHEQLWHMIAALDPGTVAARATQLTAAATTIKEIGEALKRHEVRGWQGEAAQAFHDWAGRAGNATLRLSEYSATSGDWLSRAGQVMYETRGEAGVPPYDPPTAAALTANIEAARAAHNDPDAQRIAHESRTKLTTAHERAIDGLRKLAEAYEQSTTQLNKAEFPTFPPVPESFVPTGYAADQQDASRSEGPTGGAITSRDSKYAAHSALGGAPSSDPGWMSGRQPPADTMLPPSDGAGKHRAVGLGLDDVGTLQDKSLVPPASLQLDAVPVDSGGGIIPGSAIHASTLPPIGGGSAGVFPGLSAPGGKAGDTPSRDTGIVGGRPVATGDPSAGIPRGTVIGSEAMQAGGRGMGGMMGGGIHEGPSGSAPGRRLAMEPGGVVGGRQPGADDRPFTQGGSGLVRGNPGAMGHGGAGANTPGRRQGTQGGERPDYLAEDAETWQGIRRVVPPVID